MAHCGRKTIKETDHAVVGAIVNKDEESGVYDDPLTRCIHDCDLLGKHPNLFTSEVFAPWRFRRTGSCWLLLAATTTTPWQCGIGKMALCLRRQEAITRQCIKLDLTPI